MQDDKCTPTVLESLKIKFEEQQLIVQRDIESFNLKQIHEHYAELKKIDKLIKKLEEGDK